MFLIYKCSYLNNRINCVKSQCFFVKFYANNAEVRDGKENKRRAI
uniref:Uncharacterized protein n=1 Tax=Podoviridae sp. ctoqT5 TaxID=2826577 RepID=A0A8S5MPM8_9CAUD|nr:MAG TPA: hypothetical protein [Podoviridae sp. ctoqT5]